MSMIAAFENLNAALLELGLAIQGSAMTDFAAILRALKKSGVVNVVPLPEATDGEVMVLANYKIRDAMAAGTAKVCSCGVTEGDHSPDCEWFTWREDVWDLAKEELWMARQERLEALEELEDAAEPAAK